VKSLEWAAGLFEGEGTFVVNKAKTRFLQLTMTDEDVIDSFGQAIGLGKKYQLKQLKSGKDVWRWSIHRKADVVAAIEKLLPHLGNRRAYKALNILDDLELSY
jgi:hypothetical protein